MVLLSRFSLANKGLMALVTIVLLLIGGLLIPQLKQELYPSIDLPVVTIVTTYAGASPSAVEKEVTNPLEQSIQGTPGLQQYTSLSNEGSSIISVTYDYGTNIAQARQDLSQRLSAIQAQLPKGATPTLQSYSTSDIPIISLGVSSSQAPQDLAQALKQIVVPDLQGIPNVARVDLTGARATIVTITLDPQKMQGAGVTFEQVQTALQADNVTLPAGSLIDQDLSRPIRVGNTFNSLQDLKDLVIGASRATSSAASSDSSLATASQATRLSDIADIQQGLEPETSLSHINGAPSVGISLTKTSAGNSLTISHTVHNHLADLEKRLGHNTKILTVFDQAPFIELSMTGLIHEGLLGALFAIVVILVSLFSLRSTLVAAVSIPLSVVVALIALWIGNYTLNILTLGGLTIAVGRVIDDSIVVLENIYRHLQLGEEKRSAVYAGVREVSSAITASTLTTVAVFLPLGFVNGEVGVLFRPFSITVAVALLASLLIALTIVPVLAYWFLRVPKPEFVPASRPQGSSVERCYIPIAAWITKKRNSGLTILAAIVLLDATFVLIPTLHTTFLDGSSQNNFRLNQELPIGTSIQKAQGEVKKVEDILARFPEIQTYQVTVAQSSFFSSSAPNSAIYNVVTDKDTDQNDLQQRVINSLHLVDSKITLSSSDSTSDTTLLINIQAPNEQALEETNRQIFDTVLHTPNLANVKSNLSAASPLVDVHIDPDKAGRYGLTPSQVGQYLRSTFTGTSTTRITLGDSQQDVQIHFGAPATSMDQLQNQLVPTSGGNVVRLSDVADITTTLGPVQVTHLDGTRTATISAQVTSNDIGATGADVQSRIAKLKLPGGASYNFGGVKQRQDDSFLKLGIAMLAAICIVYFIMAITLRSLLQPLILLVSIPFAGTGSVLLMLLTNTTLSVTSLIGLLMLIGIVVTNAIVLIDRVNQYRERGLDARSAVIRGGSERARPILMTASATILALLPMALGLSDSSAVMSKSLSIVVIGGLTSSTVLTLLLVPALYMVAEGIRERKKPVPQPQMQPILAPPRMQALPPPQWIMGQQPPSHPLRAN
ncbi:hydrogenase expression protein [Ktedonobacter sp. SOSP1-52]|uniref:efflux RND transporter permease subunit n=1 Tax=Ktedonobacter sp. SOSP1-52 TaxID=2778366 RepID=UPI001916B434|nr:efflux RND transporter permease subunit [Ktedonobacter sp. SOSP1-52]GHO68974.1 hydrogenase expression protein [Ktedonobacter sp. SOSP1-52]